MTHEVSKWPDLLKEIKAINVSNDFKKLDDHIKKFEISLFNTQNNTPKAKMLKTLISALHILKSDVKKDLAKQIKQKVCSTKILDSHARKTLDATNKMLDRIESSKSASDALEAINEYKQLCMQNSSGLSHAVADIIVIITGALVFGTMLSIFAFTIGAPIVGFALLGAGVAASFLFPVQVLDDEFRLQTPLDKCSLFKPKLENDEDAIVESVQGLIACM